LRFPFNEILLTVIEGYRFLLSIPSSLSKSKGLIVDPPSLFQDVVHLGDLRL
jgi:hypothetical protein